ncbi:hypothetical protein CDIK_0158 [Cucumispora dikerogammari]|nr:hypothetical protein CDIK_0158 [Cucumispora dikerogammari]
MHGEIEEHNDIIIQLKDILDNPSQLKKYLKVANYSKPEDIKYRLKKNLHDNLPIYLIFTTFFSIIFCIRNLQCLFFASSWVTYFIFRSSGQTFQLGNLEVTANHVLVATICSNLFYLVLFQSVLLKISVFALIISGVVGAHAATYSDDGELKELEIPV